MIMYFVIAYDLWPHLTGRPLASLSLMRAQLWLWFIGMLVTTFPWHYVGILGMPRRMAFYDYSNPAIADEAMPVVMSAFGGFILVLSSVLFLSSSRAATGRPWARSANIASAWPSIRLSASRWP